MDQNPPSPQAPQLPIEIGSFKAPPILWVLIIIVGVALIHTYTTDPAYYDLAMMAAGIVLRMVWNNDKDIDALMGIITDLKGKLATSTTANEFDPGMRGINMPAVEEPLPPVEKKPKTLRMLIS